MNATDNSAPEGPGYFGRLLVALLGRVHTPPAVSPPGGPGAPPPPGAADDSASLRERIGALEADLLEAGEKLDRMRSEYLALEAEKERAAAAAGGDELHRVFKRLAAPLALLSALSQKTLAGESVAAVDLAEAVASVERALAGAGLERIGDAGATVGYDPALHARMSGGAANPGESVVLRLPGYRLGAAVLHKAMVSVADKPGQGT